MNFNVNDFSQDEKAILRYICILGPFFTLNTFCMMQKYSEEREGLKRINEPEKVLNGLVEKGIATIKDKRKPSEETEYQFLYGLDSNGKLYDAMKVYWEARALQDRVCP